MATVAAHGLLVALHAAAEVLDERRAAETDGRVRAAELVRDELEDVRALELLEVDALSLLYASVVVSWRNGARDGLGH